MSDTITESLSFDSRVIGLDLSLNGTAWCDGKINASTLRFSGRKADPKGDDRLVAIRKSLDAPMSDADVAIIESLPPYGKGSASLGLVHGVVRELAASHGLKVGMVAPTSLKKYATGSGKATKEDMKFALLREMICPDAADGWDDNQVDAWWLWTLGCDTDVNSIVKWL